MSLFLRISSQRAALNSLRYPDCISAADLGSLIMSSHRQNGDLPSAALDAARAEADAAIEQARRAHARLRNALDILPEGIVFLDHEGRYILWNKQYAEIYKRSADLFRPGARLEDTLRVGVARGDYPDAIGREEEWLSERLALLKSPRGRHEQRLADGRCILIEECQTSDGGVIGLRVDITQMKQREDLRRPVRRQHSVPMFVCDRASHTVLAVNDAAVEHYGDIPATAS